MKLGEILVLRNLITRDQLNTALNYQQENGQKLGQLLVASGFLTSDILHQVLYEQYWQSINQ